LQNKPENPLNVLRNSGTDLTGKMDLKNKYYYLSDYVSSKGVIITADGKQRTSDKSNSSIREKQQITLKYSKNRFYDSIREEGHLFDPNISRYLRVSENNITINYDAFSENSVPKTKTIYIRVEDRKGNLIEGTEIQCKIGYQQPKTVINGNTINFSAEELGEQWRIVATKTPSLYSEPKHIIPEQVGNEITVTLLERKRITIEGAPTGAAISIGKSVKNADNNNGIEFVGEEVEQQWKIEITHHDFETITKTITPEKEGEVIKVVPKEKKYTIDAGKHGTRVKDSPRKTSDPAGKDVEKSIKAKRWYKFTGFEPNEHDILVAQYRKKSVKKRIAAASAVLLIVMVGVGLFWLFPSDDSEKKQVPLQEHITTYLQGDSLCIERLQKYKEKWKGKKPTEGSGKDEDATITKEKWKEINQKIKRAIQHAKSAGAETTYDCTPCKECKTTTKPTEEEENCQEKSDTNQ
jgi:hypothetical protein